MRQIYAYDSAVGFRFVPGLKARVRHEGGGYLIRVNESGFRCDHPFTRERAKGMRRVLLFGDSFTAGEGVSNGSRYGDWLERLVPNLEVLNYGMPATGLDQHYLIYREWAKSVEHDLLVLGIFVENVRRVGSRFRHFHDEYGNRVLYAKPYFTLDDQELTLHAVPPPKRPVREEDLGSEDRAAIFTRERFPAAKRAFNRLRRHPLCQRTLFSPRMVERIQKLVGYKPLTEYEDPSNTAWLTMRALLEKWISEHDRPVLVVPIPLYHYVAGISDASAYQARLAEATEAGGGAFFDPLEGLKSRSVEERRELYYEGDRHLTNKGHEALGRCLAPVVKSHLEGEA